MLTNKMTQLGRDGRMDGFTGGYWCCHCSKDCSMNIKLELQLNIFAKIAYNMFTTMPPEQKRWEIGVGMITDPQILFYR